MTTEAKWGLFWAACITVVATGEYIALKSGHPHAPASHHIRKYTRRLGNNEMGKALILGGASWLHRHLYTELEKL